MKNKYHCSEAGIFEQDLEVFFFSVRLNRTSPFPSGKKVILSCPDCGTRHKDFSPWFLKMQSLLGPDENRLSAGQFFKEWAHNSDCPSCEAIIPKFNYSSRIFSQFMQQHCPHKGLCQKKCSQFPLCQETTSFPGVTFLETKRILELT